MAPPDSRKQVGGLCHAKAEAVSHDAKLVFGALLDTKWLTETVSEVINHQPEGLKRATAYILAKYKIGNTECEKSIPLQSLKAQLPDAPAARPRFRQPWNLEQQQQQQQQMKMRTPMRIPLGLTITTAMALHPPQKLLHHPL